MDENSSNQLIQALNEFREIMASNSQILARQTDTLVYTNQLTQASMKKEDIDKVNSARAASEQNKAFSDLTGNTRTYNRAQQEAREQQEANARALQNYNDALKTSASAIKSIFNELVSQQNLGSFNKYSKGVEQMGDAVAQATSHLPILGKSLGLLVQGITKVASLYSKQADDLLKATDELAKFGTAGGYTAEQFLKLAHDSNVTSKNLDILVKPITSLNGALTTLGDTSSAGAKAFTQLTKITSSQREEFQRLGVSQSALMQTQADYIQLQTMSGRNLRAEMKDKDSLQRASLNYQKTLLELAELTGTDTETIKRKQQEAATDEAFMIKNIQMEAKAKKLEKQGPEGEAQAAQIRKQSQAMMEAQNRIAATGDKNQLKAFQEMMTTGTLTRESSQVMARLGMVEELQKLKGAVDKGLTGEELIAATDRYQKKGDEKLVEALSGSIGTASMLSKETGALFGAEKDTLKRLVTIGGGAAGKDYAGVGKDIREQQDKASKPGFDAAQDARAKLTTLEITAAKALDQLILSGNVLVKGFGGLTSATALLQAATLGAAGALGLMGGLKLVGGLAKGAGSLAKGAGNLLKGKGPLPPGGGGAASTAAKTASTAGKALGAAKAIAIPAAIGAGADTALGAMGVGKGFTEETQKKSDENWEKFGTLEKMQSGLARGIEHLGDFMFLGNMANQARKDRTDKETKYLEEKEKKSVKAEPKQPATDESQPAARASSLKASEKLEESDVSTVAKTIDKFPKFNSGLGNVTSALLALSDSIGIMGNRLKRDLLGRVPEEMGEAAREAMMQNVADVQQLRRQLSGEEKADGTSPAAIPSTDTGAAPTPSSTPAAPAQGGGGFLSKASSAISSVFGGGGSTGGATPPPVKQDVQQNLGDIKAAMIGRGMTDEKFINATLGNVMKEAGGKTRTEETDYSKTSNARIKEVFGKRAAIPDEELNRIKSTPESFAEYMYGRGNEMGQRMGNTEPGDGWKYRGRGYIQLTGKNQYAEASKAIFGDDRLVKNPDLALDPKVAANVTAWFMQQGKSRTAKKLGINEAGMDQSQANVLATSIVAGGKNIKRGEGYLGNEVIGKVDQYASQMGSIKPTSGPGSGGVASAAGVVASAAGNMGGIGSSGDPSKVLSFTKNSGTFENFKGLDGRLQQAVTNAAEEYNKTTGKKLQVNSARRDSADQQRLWDASVNAGRPGIGPSGMPIAKPGTSKHERGAAIDIQQFGEATAQSILNKNRLFQTVPNDPVHFELKAREGGMFSGPDTGYPVEMHGGELVTPLEPTSVLAKLATTPSDNSTSATSAIASSSSEAMEKIISMNADTISMLSSRLDDVVRRLETSNSIQDQILKYARV